MVQSPSREANWFAASQEIHSISRNPEVHYRNHKRPPPVSILGQPNPVHIPTSHVLEIRLNIIHSSTPRSPQWSPSLRFPNQDPIHPPSSPIRAICPANLVHLDFITRTILSEEYKLFTSSLRSLLHFPVTSSPPSSKYSPQHHVLYTALISLPEVPVFFLFLIYHPRYLQLNSYFSVPLVPYFKYFFRLVTGTVLYFILTHPVYTVFAIYLLKI